MFKILLIITILVGVFVYSKSSTTNLDSIKSLASEKISQYLPNAASQSAVLGTKAKNESVVILVEAAKRLKPEEFATLQQFICEPINKKE